MTSRVFQYESLPLLVDGVIAVLAVSGDFEHCGQAVGLERGLAVIAGCGADLALIDQGAPGAGDFLAALRHHSVAPVMWASAATEAETLRMLQCGAKGIIARSAPSTQLLACLRTVRGGSIWIDEALASRMPGALETRPLARLTPREREITTQVARGAKNREIAAALGITPGTVKAHLMHIFEKTGVGDRFELAEQARQLAELGGRLRRESDQSGTESQKTEGREAVEP